MPTEAALDALESAQFDPRRVQGRWPVVALLRVSCSLVGQRSLDLMWRECFRVAKAFLRSQSRASSGKLFVADGPWQPPTRRLEYLRLSGRLKQRFGLELPLEDEILVRSAHGIRFAGLLPLWKLDDDLVRILMTRETSFGLIHRHHTQAARTKDLFDAAFMSSGAIGTQVLWQELVAAMSSGETIVIRTTGGFDDPQVSLDFVGRSEDLAWLVELAG